MTNFCRLSSALDYREEAEAIINFIVTDIIKECQNRGENVSEPLVAFMVGICSLISIYYVTSLKHAY